MNLTRVLFAIAITLAPFSAYAHGRGHHHRWHYYQHFRRHHHPRHSRPLDIRPRAQINAERLLKVAERYVGSRKFTRLPGPWCRDAANVWLRQAGFRTDNSRLALDALALGPKTHDPVPGSLAVMRRKGGGHVGVVERTVPGGVVLVSGNSIGGRVARAFYPFWRIIAFVIPRKA